MDKHKAALYLALALAAAVALVVLIRGGQPTDVVVTLSEYRIETSSYVIKKGDMVRLTIRNEGQAAHELEIEGYDLEAEDIQPGETRTLSFRATRAGMVELVCHLDGHYEQGMRTSLEIRD